MENNDKLHYIYNEIVKLYGDNFVKYLPNILNHIANYVNKAMDVLSTKNMGLHLFYTTSMENDLYDCCSVEKAEIIRIIKSCKNIKQDIPDATMPIYNFLLILSCFYKQHEKEIMSKYKLKSSPADYVLLYLGLRVYSICQRQIFHYEPKQDIMDYTIEHLNGKFHIVQFDNVFSLIENQVFTNNKSLEADLNYIEDPYIYEWISKLIHRLKNILKGIYQRYIDNYNAKKGYTNDAIVAKNKEDGKSFYTEISSASNDIVLTANKYVNAIIGETVVREDIIKLVIKRGQKINAVKLTSIIDELTHDKESTDRITNIIVNIVSYWIVSCNRDVESFHSMDFIKSAISVYGMSNTKNDYILAVKQILNEVILKYGSSLMDVSKTSTVNAFKQDIYLYIVFYMATVK